MSTPQTDLREIERLRKIIREQNGTISRLAEENRKMRKAVTSANREINLMNNALAWQKRRADLHEKRRIIYGAHAKTIRR